MKFPYTDSKMSFNKRNAKKKRGSIELPSCCVSKNKSFAFPVYGHCLLVRKSSNKIWLKENIEQVYKKADELKEDAIEVYGKAIKREKENYKRKATNLQIKFTKDYKSQINRPSIGARSERRNCIIATMKTIGDVKTSNKLKKSIYTKYKDKIVNNGAI
eukprot:TRINITY_DN3620_c0_g2_i2.p1 TRINITY_DN3620_c0_g2~~TRINITY_DN3620_c0_g2_i2.p1  ORF type:complete len:159 (-),score=21.72 TRINITY_DN3620_c0_g2_i2:139-615(-)